MLKQNILGTPNIPKVCEFDNKLRFASTQGSPIIDESEQAIFYSGVTSLHGGYKSRRLEVNWASNRNGARLKMYYDSGYFLATREQVCYGGSYQYSNTVRVSSFDFRILSGGTSTGDILCMSTIQIRYSPDLEEKMNSDNVRPVIYMSLSEILSSILE